MPAVSARVADFIELTKPRITFLVLVTAAVGYALGLAGSVDPFAFVAMLAGTAFLSAGGSVLNQHRERDTDAQMERTRRRPLPAGRIVPWEALAFGLALSAGGLLLLASVNALSAGLGAGALVAYVLVYTPLKRLTSLCTVVGAVPGAIPPLIGWAAAAGSLSVGAWALFALLFLWQLPHFLAIGWIYRDDYARAGFPMLTVGDPDGTATGRQMVLYTAALIPVTLVAGTLASAGPGYLAGATALGLAFLGSSLRFASCPSKPKSIARAKSVFLMSILYLPALLGLLVLDR